MTTPATFAVRLPVEPGKVEEFCRAIGLAADSCSGYAPPTFTAVTDHFGATVADMVSALGYPTSRVLHGEESIEYPCGPLVIGASLSGEARHLGTDHVQARSGPLELVQIGLELADGEGTVVARITRTLVVLPEQSPGDDRAGST